MKNKNTKKNKMKSLLITFIIGIFMIGLASAGTITVTLNSPTHLSTEYDRLINFNATASTDSGYLTNMSLYTSSTGGEIWGLRNTTTLGNYSTQVTIPDAYSCSGSFDGSHPCSNAVDGSFSTYAQVLNSDGTTAYVYFNYTKPDGVTSADWYKRYNTGSYDTHTIPTTCLNYFSDTISLRARLYYQTSPYTETELQCYNGSWSRIVQATSDYSGAKFWEGRITFNGTYLEYTDDWDYTIPKSLVSNQTHWNVQACDSEGDCGFATSNYTVILDSNAPTINILYPTGILNYLINGDTLNLNVSVSDTNLDSCWYNYNGTNVSYTCNTNITFNIGPNNYLMYYANDTAENLASENVTWNYKVFENSRTYNANSYETANETYSINVTANSSLTAVRLIYDGTEYTTTQSGTVYSRTLDIPLVSSQENNTFLWKFTYAGENFNSSSDNQTIDPIYFGPCNATYSTPFINFTFKNETDSSTMTAATDLLDLEYWIGSGTTTKTYTTTNATEAIYYGVCSSATDRTIYTDLTYKYSSDGFPLRTYSFENTGLTNSTTNVTLYLLSSEDGIYSSFQTLNSAGGTIIGVLIIVERQINGEWVQVGRETTGSDGVATFWVNPNFQHRITASKTGYTTTQVTITPSQSIYSITLSSSSGDAAYTSEVEGLTWVAYPKIGELGNGTTNFNVTVLAANDDLEDCMFELINGSNTSQVLDSTTGITNSSYCFLQLSYATTPNTKIFGRLSVDTEDSDGFVIVDTDWKWIIVDLANKKAWSSIKGFFEDLTTIGELGEGNEGEFSRLIIFFVLSTIFIGVFCYFTGVEISNPIASLMITWGLALFATLGGILTFTSASGNLNETWSKWGVFLIYTLLVSSFYLNNLRKENE